MIDVIKLSLIPACPRLPIPPPRTTRTWGIPPSTRRDGRGRGSSHHPPHVCGGGLLTRPGSPHPAIHPTTPDTQNRPDFSTIPEGGLVTRPYLRWINDGMPHVLAHHVGWTTGGYDSSRITGRVGESTTPAHEVVSRRPFPDAPPAGEASSPGAERPPHAALVVSPVNEKGLPPPPRRSARDLSGARREVENMEDRPPGGGRGRVSWRPHEEHEGGPCGQQFDAGGGVRGHGGGDGGAGGRAAVGRGRGLRGPGRRGVIRQRRGVRAGRRGRVERRRNGGQRRETGRPRRPRCRRAGRKRPVRKRGRGGGQRRRGGWQRGRSGGQRGRGGGQRWHGRRQRGRGGRQRRGDRGQRRRGPRQRRRGRRRWRSGGQWWRGGRGGRRASRWRRRGRDSRPGRRGTGRDSRPERRGTERRGGRAGEPCRAIPGCRHRSRVCTAGRGDNQVLGGKRVRSTGARRHRIARRHTWPDGERAALR
jgi:hypothetical protein